MTEIRAFLSGTLADLVEHRRALIDVCLELGIHPINSEPLADSPSPHDAIVDTMRSADILIMLVGFRYGYVPPNTDVSVVEMEYDLASSIGMPRVVFMMSDAHPVSVRELDLENAARMARFRNRLHRETTPAVFGSVAELRALAARALRGFAERPVTGADAGSSRAAVARKPFVSSPPPSSTSVVGRDHELERLDAWCNGRPPDVPAPTMLILGHGGIGKTTLAWRFFESPATQRFDRAGGKFWWSFYESPDVGPFQSALLAYVGGPKRRTENLRDPGTLLRALRDEEILIVLDGVERLLAEDAPLEIATPLAAVPRTSDYPRRIVDAEFQRLVLELPSLPKVRTMLTSRTIPADLELYAGAPRPGFEVLHVGALTDDDVVGMLRRYGVQGSPEDLEAMARKTAGVPLVARLVASQVMHTGHVATELDALTTKSSLRGLIGESLNRLTSLQAQLLGRIARSGKAISQAQVAAEAAAMKVGPVELDEILSRLENVQLLEWNRAANTYSVHPLVRDAAMKSAG